MRRLLSLGLLGFLLSCQAPETKDSIQIVCTTGILGDLVAELVEGIDSVEVHSLMGPGTDPHLYKASQGDVFLLSKGDLIIYHGLHLEGKMQTVLEKLDEGKVYAAAEALNPQKLIQVSDYDNTYDPHVWFDLKLWAELSLNLQSRLVKMFPDQKALLKSNAHRYRKTLDSLHNWATTKIKEIPENQRVLITAHDAFKYFGAAFNIEVRGLQGISTTAEFGIRDVSDLANFISEQKIPAIFVESSVSPRAIEAVIEASGRKGHELHLGGELYSDALGEAKTTEGHFTGMFIHNVNTISEALKK